MAKMVFDEWFGTISYAQRAAYRKYNVTPVEHTELCEEFGEQNHDAITAAVKRRSLTGYYRAPLFGDEERL